MGWLGAPTLIHLEFLSLAYSLACLGWAGALSTNIKLSGFWFSEFKTRTGTWLSSHLLGVPGLVYFCSHTSFMG